jgi:hypothetical protein
MLRLIVPRITFEMLACRMEPIIPLHVVSLDAINGDVSKRHRDKREAAMSISTILIVILILAVLGALPTWGHSANWGYGPSGGLGVLVAILVILLLTGRL